MPPEVLRTQDEGFVVSFLELRRGRPGLGSSRPLAKHAPGQAPLAVDERQPLRKRSRAALQERNGVSRDKWTA